jgi:ABC-2 type transport system ATP-binding protein
MLRATDLCVDYRRGWRRRPIRALDHLDVSIAAGDVFALLGQNGAGKSTLMRCFLGLVRPTSGTVRVLDAIPEPGAPVFERIAYLPEEPIYHPYLTVEEAVSYFGALYLEPLAAGKIREAIARVGLDEFRDLRLAKCSKGMKQKTGLAVCLLRRPDILLLDEPTRGLDPLMVKESRDLLLELHAGGTTILLNSHVLSEVEAVATRVGILDRGRMVAIGSRQELMPPDASVYDVEIRHCPAPPFLTVAPAAPAATAETVVGRVDADAMGELMAWLAQHDGVLVRAGLRQPTLEEVFLAKVRPEAPRSDA